MSRIGKAVVFGGSGFVGQYIIRQLVKTATTIVVPSRYADRVLPLKVLGAVGQIVPFPMHLANDQKIAEAVAHADVVINCVGILAESSKSTFDAVQHDFPRRLAKAAQQAGVKQFIHLSAIGADAQSASSYAQSKARGEQAILEVFPKATILRPSLIFGAEDKFFNLFATMAKFSPILPLIGGGKTLFQPVYVADVADAVMAVLDKPAARGKTYELGGPKVYSFKQLLEIMLKETGQKCLLLPVPMEIARVKAFFLEKLPNPLLTRDQLILLGHDNVVSKGALSFKTLDLEPTALEVILPTYMERFRKGGRWARQYGNV
jgi:NADH dehydrogenase